MRTTLSIDDDVLHAAQERARHEKRSVGSVVSELARAGLTERGRPTRKATASPSRHGFRPLPHRGPAVTNTLIDQLLEEDSE
jgi:hypothetical protein